MEYEIPIKQWIIHFEGEDKKEIIFSFLRKYSDLYWTNTGETFGAKESNTSTQR